jgi:lipopolysaccharide export LptBFGC system permease protein LptF
MYVKYMMAGFLAIFAITMMIQFVVQFLEAIADKRGEPGARETHADMI